MVFNSLEYVFFLPAVLGLYWLIRRRTPQNALLLIASYVFYGAWDYRFLGLLWISTLTDFTVGRLLARTSDDGGRKRIFLVSLAVNLGILGFFKYFNFFADSFADLLGSIGLQAHAPTLRILLPIGISFYTFHGISYTFDVYRRHIEPTRSLLDFAVFVAYFPQLVAGPIGRAQAQLPQFAADRSRPDTEQIRSGLFLILLGLFKKVAIADALAPMVNQVYANPRGSNAIALVAGALGFAFQVYGDFSGYSDMARGSSRLFGIELLNNFSQPYLSRNITSFWQTWHISLSSWLRDYLYVPLGGNRGGRLKTYRNLMITMLLGGLWHGAAWTFVVFGGIQGLYLSVHRAFGGRQSARGAPPRVGVRDVVPIGFTFGMFVLSLVVFRANSLSDAGHYLKGIFTLQGGRGVGIDALAILFLAVSVMLVVDLLQRNGTGETPMLAWRPAARGLAYAALAIPIVVFTGGTPVPFVYFQF